MSKKDKVIFTIGALIIMTMVVGIWMRLEDIQPIWLAVVITVIPLWMGVTALSYYRGRKEKKIKDLNSSDILAFCKTYPMILSIGECPECPLCIPGKKACKVDKTQYAEEEVEIPEGENNANRQN